MDSGAGGGSWRVMSEEERLSLRLKVRNWVGAGCAAGGGGPTVAWYAEEITLGVSQEGGGADCVLLGWLSWGTCNSQISANIRL